MTPFWLGVLIGGMAIPALIVTALALWAFGFGPWRDRR